MKNMNENEKAKLKWLMRRGMLELDILLERFLKAVLPDLTRTQYQDLEALLQHSDPDLLNWLMGHEVPEDKETARVIAWMQKYTHRS